MYHRLKIAILQLVFLAHTTQASDYDYFQLENKLEEMIKGLIKEHITADEYLVIVKVDPDYIKKQSAPKKSKDALLPYSTLMVNPDIIKDSFNFNTPDKMFTVPLTVELIFDERVYEEKQNNIVKKLQANLKLDTKDRKLVITKSKLINPKPKEEAEQKVDANESLRIQMESLKLQAEREKLASMQDRSQIERSKIEVEDKLVQAKKQFDDEKNKWEEEKKKSDESKSSNQKTILDRVVDFQMTIFAVVLGLVLLIGVFMASLSLRGGASTLSDGVTKMADTLASALKKDSGFPGSGDTSIGINALSSGGSQGSGRGTQDDTPILNEKTEQYLALIEEKVEVLSKEGNLGFYRVFINFVDDSIAYASAILVSLSPEIAKKLVGSLSVESIDKIKSFLSENDGLRKAKNARREALEAFYGAIAMDEYLDSPLMKIKNISYLSKLGTLELRDLALKLDKDERTKFLGCFSPSRISMILDKTPDGSQKDQILECIIQMDQATIENIEELFAKVSQIYESIKSQTTEKIRKLVDGPRYVAKIIASIGPDNRTKLMERLGSRNDFMEAISQYYISFSVIEKLSDRMVSEIFGKRPANQVAIAVFDAEDDLRDVIIRSMPEMLQESVREELTTLVEDESSEKRNRIASQKVQEEICKYLLMLNKDGLLEYKNAA